MRPAIPAMDELELEMVAAADASLEPTVMPTSAAPRAIRSLMPSPQYMQVFFKPCQATEHIPLQSHNLVSIKVEKASLSSSFRTISWVMYMMQVSGPWKRDMLRRWLICLCCAADVQVKLFQ